MAVEITAEGLPPDVVKLPQTGLYIGVSNIPVPAMEHLYVLVSSSYGDVIYQYRHTDLASLG